MAPRWKLTVEGLGRIEHADGELFRLALDTNAMGLVKRIFNSEAVRVGKVFFQSASNDSPSEAQRLMLGALYNMFF